MNKESKLAVTLMAYTPNPDETVGASARLCYSSDNIGDVVDKMKSDEVGLSRLINRIKESGHGSPFEHASFTFGIEGVSRVLTHQLVRHRTGKYSQKSQRYVSEGGFKYVVPETIKDDKEEVKKFYERMDLLNSWYEEAIEAGIPKEDARYYLPNATETKIVVTMDARNLMNFFKHRCCNRAQWEIRHLADKMLLLVREVAPIIFSNVGAPCSYGGKCTEGFMTCGNPREAIEDVSVDPISEMTALDKNIYVYYNDLYGSDETHMKDNICVILNKHTGDKVLIKANDKVKKSEINSGTPNVKSLEIYNINGSKVKHYSNKLDVGNLNNILTSLLPV